MTNDLRDFHKLSHNNMNTAAQLFGTWHKNFQAIASEMGAYSKQAFEDSTTTFERLLSAKSIEEAMRIQSEFAQRAMEGYMQHMSRLNGMYTNFADDAYTPFGETKSEPSSKGNGRSR